jgi:hypothetical protein
MQRAAFLAYLGCPVAVAVGAFVYALWFEPFGINMFAAYVVEGILFYAAPHLLWVAFATLAKSRGLVWHAGFIAASVALAVVLILSFTVHDRSGLPLQWLVYWPLALVLQVILVGASVLLSCRRRGVGA